RFKVRRFARDKRCRSEKVDAARAAPERPEQDYRSRSSLRQAAEFCARARARDLVDGVLGGVAVAGDHFNFDVFTLLIFHLQRAAIGTNHLHFQLAVGAIQLVVAGMIRERILLANIFAYFLKNLVELGLETREEGAASGHRRESLQLVVGL